MSLEVIKILKSKDPIMGLGLKLKPYSLDPDSSSKVEFIFSGHIFFSRLRGGLKGKKHCILFSREHQAVFKQSSRA